MERGTPAPKLAKEISGGNHEPETVSSSRLRIGELLQRPFDIRSIALTGLFILAVFYTIYFMRAILLPLVLALLLSYLLRPIVRSLARLKIAPAFGAAIVLATLIATICYGIFSLATPAALGWKRRLIVCKSSN
jgi:predicted PurR-regulated permease PerM